MEKCLTPNTNFLYYYAQMPFTSMQYPFLSSVITCFHPSSLLFYYFYLFSKGLCLLFSMWLEVIRRAAEFPRYSNIWSHFTLHHIPNPRMYAGSGVDAGSTSERKWGCFFIIINIVGEIPEDLWDTLRFSSSSFRCKRKHARWQTPYGLHWYSEQVLISGKLAREGKS